MSVRFVIGRAGSGKTWRCLEAVRAALRTDPARGGRLLLLVPEQASFQMERALVETPDIPGYTRCEVLSFRRLAYRIFAETGVDPRRGDETIGPLGRLMVMRRLIRNERGGLQLLDRVADRPGLVKQVSGTIEELMRENVAPEDLAGLAQRIETDNPLGAAKLADVTRLYRAYLDYLTGDRLDPAQYLNLAAQRLGDCGWLVSASVWVDGFAGFTRQETDLLIELARRVKSMEIALLVDPDASAVRSNELPKLTLSLFARTERTLVTLRNEMTAAGVAAEDPVLLKAEAAPRFRRPELADLERCLFRSEPVRASGAAVGQETVCVQALPDRRCEVEAAVAEIQRLTREADPPMRYRDIAVIVRDLDPYHDLLSAAMRAAGIPCFIDRRQSTVHHPLIELVRSLMAIAEDDCRLESVRLTLKSGLLPIGPQDADLLENYLLAHGIASRSRWEEVWTRTRIFGQPADRELTDEQKATMARVNAARKMYLAAVNPWLDAAGGGAEMTGRSWATALFECLQELGVPATLQLWAERAEDDGDAGQAAVHRQVWTDFLELLDEFVRALGTESMRIEPFREAIEAGLAEFDLGLAPPTLDQVVVGTIERSRQPAIRAVLLLGFDHLHYPRRRTEDPLLGDSEREALEDAGVAIGPSRRRQMLDERMLAYIALTRASERLWISYPQADADGQAIQPAAFLREILAALPGLKVETPGDPRTAGAPRWIAGAGDLGGRLAGELRYRPVLDKEQETARREIWNALYEAARNRTEWHQTLERALAGLRYVNSARLDAALVTEAAPPPLAASVSRLESFAKCPFAHFSEYWLGLKPRVEAEMDQAEVGTVCHLILERFVADLVDSGKNLSELQDDEISERIDAAAEGAMPMLGGAMMLDEARNAFLVDRGQSYMRRAARWQRDAAKVGRFRPKWVEFPFGYPDKPGGPMKLTTPKGRTILLRGRIDRVDLAEVGEDLLGLVIDYKTTTGRTLDYAEVYHGLSLQLPTYLLALQQMGQSLTGRPIQPAAALYLPLLEPFKSVAHPSEEKHTSYELRGLVCLDGLDVLDDTARKQGGSRFLSARIKKDGTPYAKSDLATREQMSAVIRHVGRRMGELADDLLDGRVDVSPYRLRKFMPCSFCPFHAVCRYEIETQPPRALDSYDKKSVLDLLAGGGADA